MKSIKDTTRLNNEVSMPWLGLGVYKAEDGREVVQAVHKAIEIGYRSIDTASLYANEAGVGEAIRTCGLPREELFITTKVWNTEQGYDETLQAFERSRQKLGLDMVDLYLVHWPISATFVETYKALEKLYRDGWVRAIGVSNFNVHHLEKLKLHSQITPAVNQVEFHPFLSQRELRDYCKQQHIQLEAWSPLVKGSVVGHPVLESLAAKHNKTAAQVVLRWDLQHEVVTIPKSVTPERIAENADIFDFELSRTDMQAIDSLNENRRTGGLDPDKL